MPDSARGQALWGYAAAAAGLALAILSPILGSVADASGAKKPWIVGACTILGLASGLLWFASPEAAFAVPLALAAFAVATVAAEIAAVFNNAMMARVVGGDGLGRLSGTGWAVGYAGGLASLVVALGFLIASPETGRTVFGFEPLFGLDPGLREGDRASGPFSALWLLLFLWPLLLFTPDSPPTGLRLVEAIPAGLARLRATWTEAKTRPGLVRFLVANLVYQDALVALFAFGGIYGAGVFGWGPTELGLFGILLTISGTAGALAGGRLDDRLGAKAVIMASLVTLILVCLGILSLGRAHILFVIETVPPSAGDGLYASGAERLFVALGLVIGAVAGPLQASSRAYLARAVPAEDAGRYFGLFTLSGKLTSFLAPLAVALATQATGSQAAAPAVLIALFTAGLVLAATIPRG